jgi:predicted DNA-binding protein
MKETSKKKDLHVRINIELYEKLRQISFYERRTLTEVISRLIAEYVEEKAIDELDLTAPMIL